MISFWTLRDNGSIGSYRSNRGRAIAGRFTPRQRRLYELPFRRLCRARLLFALARPDARARIGADILDRREVTKMLG